MKTKEPNISSYLEKLSIFRVGIVNSVDGRMVNIKVDKDKNVSHLIYEGSLIKNVSVGSYLKILKGFNVLIAKVESEFIKEDKNIDLRYHPKSDEINRFLVVKLIGYFEDGQYHKGVKEMPLIGNECLLLDNEEFANIHKFAGKYDETIRIGSLLNDENVPISIGIDKLFTSHIGIFGNTGSGKSYTLANLYKRLFETMSVHDRFRNNAKFLIFDFNGEYSGPTSITEAKKVYKLSTRRTTGDKIPLSSKDILKPELFYILASATEKTQQPFIKRVLALYHTTTTMRNQLSYTKGILKKLVEKTVCMNDIVRAKLLCDYLEEILPHDIKDGIDIGLQHDLNWHGTNKLFYTSKNGNTHYFTDEKSRKFIPELAIYKAIDKYRFNDDFLQVIIDFMHIQLIQDVQNNRAMNEHIAPAIGKLKSIMLDFSKVFDTKDSEEIDFWEDNYCAVIDLNDVNINMRKLIPLLCSQMLYSKHKLAKEGELTKSLNIIIDEAHNILSYESSRESESWKDFRLETFEEIIKEGRKFGVFLTLASQRPSDISPTIVSQLHNYLIHRLVNNRDLEMIEKAVSYLDKLSIESLPILPVGACVLSGTIADLPVIVQIDRLEKKFQPDSENISLTNSWFDDDDDL